MVVANPVYIMRHSKTLSHKRKEGWQVIKSIKQSKCIDNFEIDNLEERLAIELEGRFELDTCPGTFCNLWHAPK